jgi:hypothetical protein
MDKISIDEMNYRLLYRIYITIKQLPFGETAALPWCRESFINLDEAIKDYEKYLQLKLEQEEKNIIDFEEDNNGKII